VRTPFIVMSAITGRPAEQEIAAYLEQLRENGIEQFMVYPRSGCELEYLSEEWFVTIAHFIVHAKRLDMKMWLYDEFNWPSGDAGGRVTAKGYRLRGIKIKGEDKGRISWDSLHNSDMFGSKLFPDLLSHEAMDYFIECTHEKYYEYFGEYFGTVIQGMFTDEPSVNYACGQEDVPYYDGLEADYFRKCGRTFAEDLQKEHEELSAICLKLVSERFRECFLDKISSWCREHELILTGHLMADDALFGSTRTNGDLLADLQAFMLPGVDEIRTEMEQPHRVTLFNSIEYVRSRKKASAKAQKDCGAMAELFALGPCDMSYAKKRCMLYYASCFKINHYFLAISPMDMRGNAKITDYFNCFTTAQPDFAGMRLLAEDAKDAAAMAELDFVPDVLVRYAVSLCAKHITDESRDYVFIELAGALSFRQLQWKYIAEGEVANGVPVIEFTDEFAYCLDGFVTGDPMEICDRLSEKCQNALLVSDLEGNPVPGLFVRKYDNGDVIVLNLSAPAGEYLIAGKAVCLDPYAVYKVSAAAERTVANVTFIETLDGRQPLREPFAVSYGNPNIIRTMYLNEQTRAEVLCECEEGLEVVFSVREGVNARLGEKALECPVPDEIMPQGFRKFYGMSDSCHLKKGANPVTAEKDLKYFPSVLVSGDFAAEVQSGELCRVVLRERKREYRSGERFADYGKVEYAAIVVIPEGAKALALIGTTLYTRVSIDDRPVGERIYSPYVFDIDKELQGRTVTLKIEQFSGLGPIFGDTDYYDKHSKKVGWKGTPATGTTLFGFEEMNWIVCQEEI